MDADGRVHIAAAERGSDGIYYLTNVSGDWTEERLTTAPRRGTDIGPSIDIDDNGSLWIGFTRWTRYSWCWFDCRGDELYVNDGIYYIRAGPAGWSEPMLLSADATLGWFKVKAGQIHVTYARPSEDGSAAYYATHAEGRWTSTEITANGTVEALRVDGDGRAQLIYVEYDANYTSASYFRGTATVAGVPEAEALPYLEYAERLGFDHAGQPYAAAGSSLYRLSDGRWSPAREIFAPITVEIDEDAWEATPYVHDVDFDAQGALHAISQDNGDGIGVVYATDRGGQLRNDVLIPTGMWADAPPPPASLVIDHMGRPQLLFVLISGEEDDVEGLWHVVGTGYP